ncbi:hypothetical protein TWF481_011895 [Arthrobotrys musiformis]|uniref:SWIM-type domain-containing protein n=1 Tax=Arthrobotrys musiformis TaxID=47236 RepID=A0AAV9VVG6_9PEZI
MAEFDNLAEINGVSPLLHLPDGGTHEVNSQSSSSKYTIKRTYDHYYCTCPGWRINGGPVNARTCKHLKSLLGERYEWERIESRNPGVQAPLSSTVAVKKGKKVVKKEVEEDESTESSSSSSSDDEDEEMSFSELEDMDPEQLAIEKEMMERRMERINALLRAARAKGKKRASRQQVRAERARVELKGRRTITGQIPRNQPPEDEEEEEEEEEPAEEPAELDDEEEEEEEDEDIDPPQPPNTTRPFLLLAEKWDQEKGIDPTGYFMSEKLDGVRAYWNGTTFLSREGNKFHAPAWFTKRLPTNITLDGELTCGRGKFIDTVSIVKTINGGDRWKFCVEYHVFDIPSMGNKKFEKRQDALKKLLAEKRIKWVKYVEQTPVKNKKHVLSELEKINAAGGEGLMLREPGSYYIQRRSKTCLKVKTFHDAEAKVIGHEEGKGRNVGRCGALKCEMMDGTGKKFKVGTGLDDNMRRSPPKVGTVITYRYFELTKDGVPRFPSFLRVFRGH